MNKGLIVTGIIGVLALIIITLLYIFPPLVLAFFVGFFVYIMYRLSH